MADVLSKDQISAALGALPDWELEGDDTIVRAVTADSFAAGIRLVNAVAVIADERNHHPDIDIRWTTITFRLSTHSEGGVTHNDLDLAAEINRVAAITT